VKYVKDTDTLHPPSRHCVDNVFSHMVVSERLSNKMVSLSKGTSSINAASISVLDKMKGSTGPVMEISVLELAATDGMVDSRVVAKLEEIGCRVALMGTGTKAFFLLLKLESILVR